MYGGFEHRNLHPPTKLSTIILKHLSVKIINHSFMQGIL